jgi:membrane fusion protein (multidrug efflux system)
MKRRIVYTVVGLLVLVAVIAGIKFLQIRRMIAQGAQFSPPPQTVTTATAQRVTWESLLTAVGSLEAVQGVTVAAELPGKVVQIAFVPGSRVKQGDLLLRQDASAAEAEFLGAEAALSLAENNQQRNRRLFDEKIISEAEFDAAVSNRRQAAARADSIRNEIAKKKIRAPFAGRLGIRLVNLGQMLKEGDAIVSLQALDPIFVNFLLPQQQLAQIQEGQPVRVTSDALPGAAIEGRITAINPQVDAETRNIQVQATLANPDEKLRPGMFANVSVVLPEAREVIAMPATAVLYAPYSDSVFVVEAKADAKSGKTGKVLRQQFVRLGAKNGDFVAVESGLREGETVVSTGVFKLRNGQAVVVDNTLAPEFQLQPQPENE